MATSSHLLLLLLLIVTTVFSSAESPPSQHADRIIEAMIGSGDFREWAADFLSSANEQFGIPISATIFIPADFDAADISSIGGSHSHRLAFAYHIVPHRLSFTDLRLLHPLSRLPTLLPGKSIVVTNNSISDFTIDGVLISEPDLFISSSIVMHGIASALDFFRYGVGDGEIDLPENLPPWPHHFRPPQRSNSNQISAHFLIPFALVMLKSFILSRF